MKILLTGGVFEDPMGEFALSAPENVLRQFLRELGHDVDGRSSGKRPRLDDGADVVHSHHFGVAAYYLAVAGVRPLVFTSHNPFLVSDFPVPESRLEHALQKLVLTSADTVVALSRREADLLSERFRLDPESFVVIPNGLDLDLYGPGDRPARDGVELLAVGQLADYKGHSDLIQALAVLAPRWPGLSLRLVAHRHDLRPELEQLAASSGVADRLRIEGPLGTGELVERYRAADVLVQPSLAECFPITVLEAMACATPVIVTDVGGMAEEVGDAGLVVPAADVRALTAAIESLVADVAERRRLGEAALVRAQSLYDGRKIAALHAELYEGLRARRRRAPAPRVAAARLLTEAYRRRGAVARLLPEAVRRRPPRSGPSSSS